MKGKLTLIATLLIITLSFSGQPTTLALQAPTPLWYRIYGGATSDRGYNIIECSDGGFAFTGYGDDYGDEYDVWFVRTDADGNQLWSRSYDFDAESDQGRSIVEVSTGGFAILGNAWNTSTWDDAWLIRTDINGTHLWNQTYGTNYETDIGWSLIEVSSGGFAFAGHTESYGAIFDDFWLVRLDASGNVLWNYTYGTSFAERCYKLIEVSSGGFAMVGNVENATHSSLTSTWMVRVDASGSQLWNRSFDYNNLTEDYCRALTEVSSGGFALGAYTNASDLNDFWLIRLDASGNHLWNKTYGGTGRDYSRGILEYGGGFVINGYTNSSGAGEYDMFLVRTDVNGVELWNMTWGGSARDRSYSMVEVSSGGLAILGYTRSFSSGDYDTFILRLPSDAPPAFDLLAWLPVIIIIVVAVIVLILVIWYLRRRK